MVEYICKHKARILYVGGVGWLIGLKTLKKRLGGMN